MKAHPTPNGLVPIFGDLIVVADGKESILFELELVGEGVTSEETDSYEAALKDPQYAWADATEISTVEVMQKYYGVNDKEVETLKRFLTSQIEMFCQHNSMDFEKVMVKFVDLFGDVLYFRGRVLKQDWLPNIFFDVESSAN
jgi:hypothetical protein